MEESASVVTLNVDSDLLNPKFEGYKLSLQKLSTYTQPLEETSAPDQVPLDETLFAFAHLRSHFLHNHLLLAPAPQDTGEGNDAVLFVDREGRLNRTELKAGETTPLSVDPVWTVPRFSSRPASGSLNVSLAQVSPDLLLVNDGFGGVYLLDCGRDFKVVHSVSGNKPSVFLGNPQLESKTGALHFLLLRVEESKNVSHYHPPPGTRHKGGDGETRSHSYLTILELHVWSKDAASGVYAEERVVVLAGPGSVEFAEIEVGSCLGLVLASQGDFVFLTDSRDNWFSERKSPPPKKRNVANGGSDKSSEAAAAGDASDPLYVWSQTLSALTLRFPSLPAAVNKEDITVNFSKDSIKASFGSTISLEGKLGGKIEPDNSTWTLVREGEGKCVLEISLSKASAEPPDGAAIWKEAVQGDKRGKAELDLALEEELNAEIVEQSEADSHVALRGGPESPPYNVTELEECDTEDLFEGRNLTRFDVNAHRATHSASLDCHQFLFATRGKLCLRSDVDGLLWSPAVDEDTGKFCVRHERTFDALGYVQAAKEIRKYTVAPPDFSWVALVDSHTHIYVYHQTPTKVTSELKNRKTGEVVKQISEQQVVSLEDKTEILGVVATSDNSQLVFLTKKTLGRIRVRVSE